MLNAFDKIYDKFLLSSKGQIYDLYELLIIDQFFFLIYEIKSIILQVIYSNLVIKIAFILYNYCHLNISLNLYIYIYITKIKRTHTKEEEEEMIKK